MVSRVRAENQISWIKRALHYPFNWIPFLQINKLCNVIAKNLTFLTNRKLISISWKVWTCSSFSTNWKWKWMNGIRHGSKNVVGKRGRKTEIWVNQISSDVIERFIELCHEEESLWNILSDNYKIRQEKEKSVEECRKN